MALSFPLSLSDFSDRLMVTEMSLHCPSVAEESQTAAGEIIRAGLGAALWQGQVTLSQVKSDCGRSFQALLDLLTRPGASFLLRPSKYTGPAGTAALSAVAGNNRDVTLSGLPSGTIIRDGAYLSWTYGSAPLRYAFHQVVRGGAAAGAGTVTVEVGPLVRPGWTAGATVHVNAPRFKAVLRQRDPGTMVYSPRFRPRYHSAMSFDFIQTLR